MPAEANLRQLGITLPAVPAPKGLYKPVVIAGNMAYTSGHLPTQADGSLVVGRVGESLDEQAGAEAARLAGLAILASLRAALGSLDRVRRVVKLFGVVNSSPDFTRQPVVLNGCSQLLADVFGPEAGVGARSAIAAPTLPLGVAVEIEAVFELEP